MTSLPTRGFLGAVRTTLVVLAALIGGQLALSDVPCKDSYCIGTTPCPPSTPPGCTVSHNGAYKECSTTADGGCCQYSVENYYFSGCNNTTTWAEGTLLYLDYAVKCTPNGDQGFCE